MRVKLEGRPEQLPPPRLASWGRHGSFAPPGKAGGSWVPTESLALQPLALPSLGVKRRVCLQAEELFPAVARTRAK